MPRARGATIQLDLFCRAELAQLMVIMMARACRSSALAPPRATATVVAASEATIVDFSAVVGATTGGVIGTTSTWDGAGVSVLFVGSNVALCGTIVSGGGGGVEVALPGCGDGDVEILF